LLADTQLLVDELLGVPKQMLADGLLGAALGVICRRAFVVSEADCAG
jgi:hypothetical protein